MVDNELGLTAVFNGCIYDYQELRAELEGHGYRFFSHSDTEVILKGYAPLGHRRRLAPARHVRVRDPRAGHRPGGPGPRPAGHQAALPRRDAEAAAVRLDAAGAAAGRRRRHLDRPGRAAPLPDLARRRPGAADAAATASASCRRRPCGSIEADGTSTEHRYWEPRYERRPEHAGWSARDWEDAVEEALRVAVRRRLVADIPVGVLLSGGLDSSLIVGLLAQEGQTGLATYSIGFESVGGREGDEFAYSDVIAEHFGTDHHRIRVGSDELAGALGHAIGAMAEPMVSHDVVAFDLLSERVSADDPGRAVGAGRRRGLRRLPLVPAAGRPRPRGRRSPTYAQRVLRPRPRRDAARSSPTGTRSPRTRAWRSSART